MPSIQIHDALERLPTEALVPYARNSRTHSTAQVEQIAASIREFGFTNPVLVDEAGGIVAGHGRVMAARLVGLPAVPCIRLTGLSDAQRRAYVIADNKLALNAGWDDAMLRVELRDLQALDFDMDLLGFNADELGALLAADDDGTGLTDPDDAPEARAQAVTRPGDVWICGRHRLLCGDSTDADSVVTVMAGAMADLWITDPPYNVAYVGKTKDALTIAGDAMQDSAFLQFLVDAFTAAVSVMKPGAVFYIWHADLEGYNFRGACAAAGLKVRQCLVWKKQMFVLGRQDYQWQHEPCLYGWKDGAGHLWASDRKQTTVLEFDRPRRSAEHPTMKPVALFEYQILNNTKGADVLLDTFGGSGTTMIAAEKNGRHARLIEIDPVYCDVIVRRWQAFTGQQATLEATGEPFPADELPP
jgi:site-specific DNA-methyltransferase (adenine-specific)